jgi:hypothetical protein
VIRFLSKDAGGFLSVPAEKFLTVDFTARTASDSEAVVGYDWTASLFTDSNVALDVGTGDLWDQTAPNKRSVFYKPCANQPVFYVDFSGAAQLKFAYTFHNYDGDDDFNQVDVGVRIGATNVIVAPSTGATIVSNNITDGDYAIQYQFRHDAKTDAYYSNTIVMNVASNVITIYRKWVQHATTYQAYESVADTKVAGNKVIQVTWAPGTNTWTIQTDAQTIFNALIDADASISTSGGTLTDNIADVAITTDASDHRIWEVTIA